MLKTLGNLIEKKPWFIILIVIIITAGFSTAIPQLEMKTDFNEFMPEDKLVEAVMRIYDNFGTSQQILLIYAEKQNEKNTITPQALRDQLYIQKNLEEFNEVQGLISFAFFIDQICQVEYNNSLENCTDTQIQQALDDVLKAFETQNIQLFEDDDSNEEIDYMQYPKLQRGKSYDSTDIKNCKISYDNTTVTTHIQVYDLSYFKETLKPPFSRVNALEWYVGFENLIIPDKMLDIEYKIAAHIEPTHPLWEIGSKPLTNIRLLLQYLRDRELFNSYTLKPYLWVKPSGQSMSFPVPLQSGEASFDFSQNEITIEVSREELGQYGIAPKFDSFELPARLGNFTAGVRYYTLLRIAPGGRFSANTTTLIERLFKLKERPLLGRLTTRMLENQAGLSWGEFDALYNMMDETNFLPDSIALKDIENSWKVTDQVPDEGVSDISVFFRPQLFEDLKVNGLAFLSEDYKTTTGPSKTLMIIQLNLTGEYGEVIEINEKLVKEIEKLDEKITSLHLEVTGEGVISSEINEVTTGANQLIGPSIFIIILFVLFINFRKTSYVLLPMLALLISAVWLFGTMVFLDIPFTVMAVALIPLVLGLGVDYAVVLYHNYRLELEKGQTPAQAIKRSVREIGRAMFLAMLTTVIAFMSFLTANVPPIRDFGILLAVGVAYTFILTITLLASLRYVLDRRKNIRVKPRKQLLSVDHIMGALSRKILSHQKKILLILILVSLIFATGAIQIRTSFDYDQFVPQDTPALVIYDKIAQDFPYSSQDQEYILIEGNVATVEVLQGIRQTHKNLEDDTFISRNTDGTIKSNSIYTIIHDAVSANETLIDVFNLNPSTLIPESDKDVEKLFDYLYENPIYKLLVPSVLYLNNSHYLGAIIGVYNNLALQMEVDQDMNDDLELLKNELNEDIEPYGDCSAVATGNFIITLEISKSLTESQIMSTGISVILAALVVIIAYKNPVFGLIAMIPVSVSILWVLGSMYYIGYSLNSLTVTITSITIGIGIDYAIHVSERFRLVADKTGDITKAMCEAISHTGGALLIAALTTTLGFGILILAPIPPQQQFGVILAITIVYSFLTSVLFLPLILVRWAKWQKKRKGFIISSNKAIPDEDDFCTVDDKSYK